MSITISYRSAAVAASGVVLGAASMAYVAYRKSVSATATSAMAVTHRAYGGGASYGVGATGAAGGVTGVDMRSDTVTKPTEAMLKAMMSAPVGDDVYGEDPTVNLLEKTVAEMAGKEAGLFVASGTMANQIGLKLHLSEMQSVIMDRRCHVFLHEAGGLTHNSRALPIPVSPAPVRGTSPYSWRLTLDDILANWMPAEIHMATTTAVSLENTLNGAVFPIDELRTISKEVRARGAKMHLDGARVWNAMTVTGLPLREYGALFDTMSVCMSKGLGAPVGSVLVGTAADIQRARKYRKMLGGGMRQAGVLAAGCLHALEHHLPLLKNDHENAKAMAAGLNNLGLAVENVVETNMVFVSLKGYKNGKVQWQSIVPRLAKEGFIMSGEGYDARIVIHHQVSSVDVHAYLAVLGRILNTL